MPKRNVPPDLTDTEELAVQAMIAADPDNPEITEAQVAQLRPFSESMPLLATALKRGPGRPPAEIRKVPVKLRIDPATLTRFKAGRPGWQTRMNDALRTAAAHIDKQK